MGNPIKEVLNPSKENYDTTLTETDILNSIGIYQDRLINIVYDPKQIARNCLMAVLSNIRCGEQHTKSLPKLVTENG